jgi:predicted CDP-diglyceride synthetase/phosphatidate cytidylyltransferase
VFVILVVLQGLAALLADRLSRRGVDPVPQPRRAAGAAAGLAVAVWAGAMAGLVADPPFTAATGAMLGAVVGVAAPLGDLVGGAVKQGAGVVRSGGPVHGFDTLGVFDAPLVCAPFVYWAYTLFVL